MVQRSSWAAPLVLGLAEVQRTIDRRRRQESRGAFVIMFDIFLWSYTKKKICVQNQAE